MNLEIISPEKVLFSGEIHLVKVPGSGGEFEIMNNHAAIISSLNKGKIKVITKEGEQLFFETNGGFVESQKNKVSLLIE